MADNTIQLRCLIIITDRGLANEICDFIKDYAHFQSIFLAKGTATNEIRTALGILEPEKEISLCFTEKRNVEKIFTMIDENFELSKKHKGIAITIPVCAVDGLTSLKILTGQSN